MLARLVRLISIEIKEYFIGCYFLKSSILLSVLIDKQIKKNASEAQFVLTRRLCMTVRPSHSCVHLESVSCSL